MREGRRRATLTQADVAQLTDVSVRWYRSLERGLPAAYSVDFLDRLAQVLELTSAERQVLYMKVVGHPPLPGSLAKAAPGEMDYLLQQFVDRLEPSPAYVSDAAWNILGTNAALRRWFPWTAAGGNVMQWIFLAPEAREQLVDWERSWLRALVAQLRFVRSQYQDDEELRELAGDVLASCPRAREAWERREIVDHADGDLRRLRPPGLGGTEVGVRIGVFTPMRKPHLRLTVLMEGDGAERSA